MRILQWGSRYTESRIFSHLGHRWSWPVFVMSYGYVILLKVVPAPFPPVSEPQQNTKPYKGMTEFIGAWKSSHTFPE